jgi:hypothetical protein
MNRNGKYHNRVDISNLTGSYTNDECGGNCPQKSSRKYIMRVMLKKRAKHTEEMQRKRNVAAIVAKQVVEVAETPNNDHQEDGSNGMAFGLRAYSNKR